MMFKYFNPHPTGNDVGDCVKRAIVVTTGMKYADVQRQLNAFKKVTGARYFYSNKNPYRYADNVLKAKKLQIRQDMTVEDFCISHPIGRFILDLPGHWVGIYNSNYYDSWDCGKENVNFAYEINTDNYSPPDVAHQMFRYCCTAEQISDTETRIRIYDGNGKFAERKIPTELTAGYILCLKHSNYPCIEI